MLGGPPAGLRTHTLPIAACNRAHFLKSFPQNPLRFMQPKTSLLRSALHSSVTFLLPVAAAGASFSYSGSLTPGGGGGGSWVDGQPMVTSIVVGTGTAANQSGFSYFAGRDIGLLTFQFADLELSNFQSPTLDQWGFMYFAEANGAPIPFRFFYDGTEIATGITDHINLTVDNDTDLGASGDGAVTLTTPGADPTFFNEVMAKTGGSGRFNVYLSADAVPSGGVMAMGGTFVTTAVPEPEEYAAIAGLGLVLWAVRRRLRSTR